MRLQRLEISGFKSFPDRADLHFDRGVTAIVGPNGCGKSNVVDAITWVLGEQSAKSLRGERMEDIIFAGSDARKPTAAAEVRLKFSGVTSRPIETGNGDGLGDDEIPLAVDGEKSVAREVEIARRLYRSGESEYLIDGESCRLRDIQDLLMDQGLGVKAYAVIEQGKIGQILSAKPTDRRQLIEEAAGVTKFKSRRRAAELKLEAAQQNLTRIDDIIYEIEKQRGSLKRQAAKARRYRRLRDELRRWEQVLFARRYRVLAQAIEAARARLAESREREAAAAAQLAAIESRSEAVRADLSQAESRATATRDAVHARELETGRLQQQIEFDRQQIALLERSIEEMGAEIEALEQRQAPVGQEIAARREAAAAADAERDEAAAQSAREQQAAQAAEEEVRRHEAAVETIRGEVFAAHTRAGALSNAIERAAEARKRIAEALARLDVETSDLRIETERIGSERARAAMSLQEGQAALESLRAARAARESDLGTARIERDWRLQELRREEQELASVAARLQSLEEIEAARAEYADAARLILAEGQTDVPHFGALAEHLEVAEAHERAVEAAFGDLLQHVIVPTAADAERGLALVREHGAGRVGFVVLEGATDVEPEAAPPAPGLVPLSTVARAVGPHAAAVRVALGQAWLAESFEQAAAAARLGVRGPVVTPQGDVFRGPQVVWGGSRGESRGILGTRREIKTLREEVARRQAAVESLSATVAEFETRIRLLEEAITALTGDLHRQEKAIVGFDMQVARAAEEHERLARRHELLAAERRRAEEERAALDARESEARAALETLAGEQAAIDERLAAAQQALAEARVAAAERLQRAADARAAHAALVERSAGLANEVRRLEDAARELVDRIDTRRRARETADARRAGLLESVDRATRELDEALVSLESLRGEVRDAEARVNELQMLFSEEEARARAARSALDAARALVSGHDIERATAESDLSHLASACQETLQASLDEVEAAVAQLEAAGEVTPDPSVIYAEEPSESEIDEEGAEPAAAAAAVEREEGGTAVAVAAPPLTAEEAIAELKAKIDRLGPVNMMAIEQFDELEARHQFLTAQRKDLVDSIAATGEAIRRIEKTTRERFREAFVAVNQYFEETFTTLFGGGKAGLVLLDESDILESGIDIIAQPPGKRLQNVQLLSGGEKALTAMALMFAIFKYRPSPFCLLDEIDAPLDDANVGRFVEMLRGMQDHTQFVLVTHHRKTMEIADRLYGVTMEEPGVSKLISIKLN